ncbi:alcohol dehydrogenase catalytic domain-containing protein [Nocardioides marmoraquaticus]
MTGWGDGRVFEVYAPAGVVGETLAHRSVEPIPADPGQVVVAVRAVGVNPTDWKSISTTEPRAEDVVVGFEAAGVISEIGADVTGWSVDDEVIVYPVLGAYASRLVVEAEMLTPKPGALAFEQAANLMVAGTTAAEMLHAVSPVDGDTVLVHGASSAVGVSLLQQLRGRGPRVLGTCSEASFPLVSRLGAKPLVYGPGLPERLHELSGGSLDAAYLCASAAEGAPAALALVEDRDRIVSIADHQESLRLGIRFLQGRDPESYRFRLGARAALADLAEQGALTVPMSRTFALSEAERALDLVRTGHPGGKLALIPDDQPGERRGSA